MENKAKGWKVALVCTKNNTGFGITLFTSWGIAEESRAGYLPGWDLNSSLKIWTIIATFQGVSGIKYSACSVVYGSPAALWAAACRAPPSMGFPRQEYWSGLLFPPAGDLPGPGIEPGSFVSPASVGGCFTTAPPQKPLNMVGNVKASITVQHTHILIF